MIVKFSRSSFLQLSPIALANMAMIDQLPDMSTIPPDDPVPFIALVSMGVDSTDLVVTNGRRIWQRSMPIGGSNFTKALVQGMKLTFARAENLKRNAVKAEDPKAVFKTMKPVFNEFAGELQRSLNYFTGNERSATIEKVLLLGNATKLRGLTEFVGQQLQLDVQRLDKFQALEGASVVGSSSFREQHLAFGTAYGLALQGVGTAPLGTNLLPDEIVRDRLIESKKPVALATLIGLLAAAVVSFAGMYGAWTSFVPERYQAAFAKAEAVKKQSTAATAAIGQVRARQAEAIAQQQWLAKVQNRRFEALDLMRAVQSLLPRDEGNEVPENPADRLELHIDRMDCQYFTDLSAWFGGLSQQWSDTHIGDDAEKKAAEGEDGEPAAGDAAATEKEETEKPSVTGPTGEGWVVELEGHHFHNESRHKPLEGAQFLRSTIIKNLMGQGQKVRVSAGPLAGQEVDVSELGIGFPIIVRSSPIKTVKIPLAVLPGAAAASGVSLPAGIPAPPGSTPTAPGSSGDGSAEPQELTLKRYDFVIQFSWQPHPAGEAAAAPGKASE